MKTRRMKQPISSRKVMNPLLFLSLSILPILGISQPELERSAIAAGGLSGTGGTTFTIGEAIATIGQSGNTQVIASFQQGSAQPDSVWPGDANDDLVANNVDLLAVGLAYGNNGPARIAGSNAWQAQAAAPWLQGLPGGVNFHHPDCNGDGLINDDDTLAINLNYGLIHFKTETEDSLGIPLALSFVSDTVNTGQTVQLDILLGTDSIPAHSAYGLAFQLELDTALILVQATEIDYGNSWMGQKSSNMLTLEQAFTVDDRIHLALTRKDHQGQNGFGMVASVIIMIDDLSGKTTITEPLKARIVNPVLIDQHGTEIPVSLSADSLIVRGQSVSLPPELAAEIRLYPNPTQGRAELDLSSLNASEVTIRDIHGRLLKKYSHQQQVYQIDLSDMAAGSYLIEVQTSQGSWRSTLLKT